MRQCQDESEEWQTQPPMADTPHECCWSALSCQEAWVSEAGNPSPPPLLPFSSFCLLFSLSLSDAGRRNVRCRCPTQDSGLNQDAYRLSPGEDCLPTLYAEGEANKSAYHFSLTFPGYTNPYNHQSLPSRVWAGNRQGH